MLTFFITNLCKLKCLTDRNMQESQFSITYICTNIACHFATVSVKQIM